jgi:hypothetical protein
MRAPAQLSDTADNRVLAVHVNGLNVNDYYASVGDAFGQVDPTTGKFTALVSAAPPGFTFGKAHGAAFVAPLIQRGLLPLHRRVCRSFRRPLFPGIEPFQQNHFNLRRQRPLFLLCRLFDRGLHFGLNPRAQRHFHHVDIPLAIDNTSANCIHNVP